MFLKVNKTSKLMQTVWSVSLSSVYMKTTQRMNKLKCVWKECAVDV